MFDPNVQPATSPTTLDIYLDNLIEYLVRAAKPFRPSATRIKTGSSSKLSKSSRDALAPIGIATTVWRNYECHKAATKSFLSTVIRPSSKHGHASKFYGLAWSQMSALFYRVGDSSTDEGYEADVRDFFDVVSGCCLDWVKLFLIQAWEDTGFSANEIAPFIDRILSLRIIRKDPSSAVTVADTEIYIGKELCGIEELKCVLMATSSSNAKVPLSTVIENFASNKRLITVEGSSEETGIERKARLTLAQVHERAANSKSRIGCLTSFYGAFFAAHIQDGALYLSNNQLVDYPGVDDEVRKDKKAIQTICESFLWLILMVVYHSDKDLFPDTIEWKTQLDQLPPRDILQDFRARFLRLQFYIRTLGWRNLICCLSLSFVMSLVHSFSVRVGSDVFRIPAKYRRRLGFSACFNFEHVETSHFSTTLISPSLGLVFKVYGDRNVFGTELMTYLALRHQPRIPTFFGSAYGDNVELPGILLSYTGKSLADDDVLSLDELHDLWYNVVKPMHCSGIHHHDLANRNITRAADGELFVIDFSHAVKAEECNGHCNDRAWFEEQGLSFDKGL